MENRNHPAFPVPADCYSREGMTKREYFAVMAMQGLIAQSDKAKSAAEFARHAVIAADALLTELEKIHP